MLVKTLCLLEVLCLLAAVRVVAVGAVVRVAAVVPLYPLFRFYLQRNSVLKTKEISYCHIVSRLKTGVTTVTLTCLNVFDWLVIHRASKQDRELAIIGQ